MSIGATQPFRPSGTATLSASTTSANVTLPGAGETVLVYNAGAATAFFRFGTDNAVTASSADTPLPDGERMLVHAGSYAKTAAAVLAAGTGVVYFTRGDGTVY